MICVNWSYNRLHIDFFMKDRSCRFLVYIDKCQTQSRACSSFFSFEHILIFSPLSWISIKTSVYSHPRQTISFLLKLHVDNFRIRLWPRSSLVALWEEIALWLPHNVSATWAANYTALVAYKLSLTGWASPLQNDLFRTAKTVHCRSNSLQKNMHVMRSRCPHHPGGGTYVIRVEIAECKYTIPTEAQIGSQVRTPREN